MRVLQVQLSSMDIGATDSGKGFVLTSNRFSLADAIAAATILPTFSAASTGCA